MPKRRAPSDDEGEVSDKAHQSASGEEVVKKSRKSAAKSEKAKASAHFDARDSYRPTTVLTSVLRHNLPKNRRKEKRLRQMMERSRLTGRGTSTLIWGVTGGQRFASSKVHSRHHYSQTWFGKVEVTRITI